MIVLTRGGACAVDSVVTGTVSFARFFEMMHTQSDDLSILTMGPI